MENFALYYVVVDISRLLPDCGDLRLGIAGDYAVDERGREVVGSLHPLYELFIHVIDLCKLGEHPVELVAVVVDEFAGNDGKALIRSAAEFFVPAPEQREELSREGLGAHGEVGIGNVERDARLGGVGDDDLQVFALAVAEEFFVRSRR